MSTTTLNTIPGFVNSEYYEQAKIWHDHFIIHGPLGPDDVDPDYVSPDLEGTVHSFDLRDDKGNGYTMQYDYWQSLKVTIYMDGERVFDETFRPAGCVDALNYFRFYDIEQMILTARSVGDAILQDEFDGCTRESFCDGYATLADRLDMDFELSDPTSNENVRCTLNVVAPDLEHYETMLSFTIPSMNLWAATDHLTTLCR